MSVEFLPTFMRFVYEIVNADRALAVDMELNMVGAVACGEDDIEDYMTKSLRQALDSGEPVATDNYSLTMSPADIPGTNQILPALRYLVVIPLAGVGAVYVDLLIRKGIIHKDVVERLEAVAHSVVEKQAFAFTESDLSTEYKQLLAGT